MSVREDLRNLSVIRARITGAGFTEGLLRAGDDIVSLASQLAPEDTGQLKLSGKAEVIEDGKVAVSFGNDLPDNRAIAQEYGTYDMPAQPYLWPAIRQIDILFYVRELIR